MDLAKKAQSLAVGNLTKQRCKENIEGIQGWIDDKPEREKQKKIKPYLDSLLRTLQLFDSKTETVANARALINQTKSDLYNIKLILGSNDDLYLKLSTRIASQAQGYVIEEVNSAQTNLETRMLYDRNNAIREIKTIVKNAWETTLLIGTLDMDTDFKNNRYNPNKNTLQKMYDQLEIQVDQSQSNRENILLAIGILNWIIVIATDAGEDYKGTLLPVIILFPWFFYFMWYTPYMLIVKIIRFFKNT
jgi:hypothetical protein